MFRLCQYSYKQSLKKLKKAHLSSDVSKKGLDFFVETIKQLSLKSIDTPLIFSDFIKDDGMLFSTRISTNLDTVDVTIETTGLLQQTLERCGVINSISISEEIKTSIFDIHTELSKNGKAPKEYYEALERSLLPMIAYLEMK